MVIAYIICVALAAGLAAINCIVPALCVAGVAAAILVAARRDRRPRSQRGRQLSVD